MEVLRRTFPLIRLKHYGMQLKTISSSIQRPMTGSTRHMPCLRSRYRLIASWGPVSTPLPLVVTILEQLLVPRSIQGLRVLIHSQLLLLRELISVRLLQITERLPLEVARALLLMTRLLRSAVLLLTLLLDLGKLLSRLRRQAT